MFDREALIAACAAHRQVARVVVAEVAGSAPREPGAAMLVWRGGQTGTIGGGALEWESAARAREMLTVAPPTARIDRLPLGPALGQCCGGAVVLVTEVYDAAAAAAVPGDVFARALDGRTTPLAVKRVLDQARGQGAVPAVTLAQGWLVEPVARVRQALWVWGAGHVGRAVVAVAAPLPDLEITWLDVAPERFPDAVPEGVTLRWAARPEDLIAQAPPRAEHLILTFSHALDLAICHGLLSHGFARCGLIGSATKWARFRSRLGALGHPPEAVAGIRCPIGDPALGKHPQAIAVGVVAALLSPAAVRAEKGMTA